MIAISRRWRGSFARRGIAAVGLFAAGLSLAGCIDTPNKPLSGPVEAMEQPWGPFSRQCASTRVSHSTYRWRRGETEIGTTYENCTGYSAMATNDTAEITASLSEPNQPPVILRILRQASGEARPATAADTGLLAQGSDSPEAAQALARTIGLTARQVISPGEVVMLPLRLLVPYPVDVVMACRPDGSRRDRGRGTLLVSCTLDQEVNTDRVDARLQLAGNEEIDVQSGVRLSSDLTGSLSGRIRTPHETVWQTARDRLGYQLETEIE